MNTILSIIQGDARITNSEIGRRMKMAPSGILERIRKLKERGVIKDYVTRLDPKAIDMDLLAFVFLKTNEKDEKWDVGTAVARIPEVLEVHDIAGEDCYILKVRTKDTSSLYRLLRDQLGKIKAITSSKTTIVLRTVKETSGLPLKLEQPLAE